MENEHNERHLPFHALKTAHAQRDVSQYLKKQKSYKTWKHNQTNSFVRYYLWAIGQEWPHVPLCGPAQHFISRPPHLSYWDTNFVFRNQQCKTNCSKVWLSLKGYFLLLSKMLPSLFKLHPALGKFDHNHTLCRTFWNVMGERCAVDGCIPSKIKWLKDKTTEITVWRLLWLKGECTQLEKSSLRLSFSFLVLYLVARGLGNLHSYKIYLSLKLFALRLV